jgi:hypothetical protein
VNHSIGKERSLGSTVSALLADFLHFPAENDAMDTLLAL